jgi:molybdopterin converting factor small subunit
MTTTTSTINTNKRSISSLKSPGITKKKRLTIKNNISNINDNNIRDTTGQNKKLPSLDEIAFFDKVKFLLLKIRFNFSIFEFLKVQKTLRSPLVFDNFLRCILLYTKKIISRIELFELIQSYLR